LSIKKIYLVRHGQTDFNLRGIVQGSGVNAPLNERGHAQAQSFFNTYGAYPFQKVYTSMLQRSIQTMAPFIERGLPHESFSELNEINWGHREGVAITPEEDAYYHWVLRQWQLGNTRLQIDGGESPEDVAIRQRGALQYIMAKSEEEKVLICMHGRAMRVLLCQLLNYPLHCMDYFAHGNLSLYILTFTGSMFRLDSYNNRSHLPESLL
jgi:broad specificity phosphatase PhoE